MANELVPTGKLRLGINGTNPTLFVAAADGSPAGIAVELGRFIAEQLGVPLDPLVYKDPGAFPASFGMDEWDIIVTGKNPHAAKFVDFIADVILIDYVYLAAAGRALGDPNQVDQPGVKVGVPQGASADAFLSQRLKFAQVVRLRASPVELAGMLRDGRIDLFATGIEGVQAVADRLPGSKIIGAFDTVVFAVSARKGLSPDARSRLAHISNAANAAGIVRDAIDRSGKMGIRAAVI